MGTGIESANKQIYAIEKSGDWMLKYITFVLLPSVEGHARPHITVCDSEEYEDRNYCIWTYYNLTGVDRVTENGPFPEGNWTEF